MRSAFVFLFCAIGVLAACYTEPPPPPTFYKNVLPIFQSVCQNCHVDGGIAPFPLVTYDDAKAESDQIASDTKTRIMPPFGARATDECKPPFGWQHDWSLTDEAIQIIQDWHAAGDPPGDPNDAPPPNTLPPITELVGATALQPKSSFTLPADSQNDAFECFLLDPNITADTYLTGTFVKPGNKTIVHHTLIFEVSASATLTNGDAIPDQYPCFGSAETTDEQLVALWAPGQQPYVYPDNVAHPLAAGTRFVMQIHYHPHANADLTTPDLTTFEYTTTPNKPEYTVGTELLGLPVSKGLTTQLTGSFPIEPNTTDIVTLDESTAPLTQPVQLLAVAPHMHLVGVDEKISLIHGSTSQCLVQVPRWDFNWQRSYAYDAPIESLPWVSPGDVLELRCTYDDSMDNPALSGALLEQGLNAPQPVKIGETTLDEMCLGAFWYVYKTP